MLRQILKILHEVGSIGVMGSFAAYVVLVVTAPDPTSSLIAYAAVRQGIAQITRLILVPSLAIVLITGLLAIAANRAFHSAGWAWVKALLGVSVFEGTLLTVGAGARRASELSTLAVAGHPDPAELALVLHGEWGGLWLLLLLSFANIVLAVWRPRFGRRPVVEEIP